MSDGELSRLEVLRDMDQRRLTTRGGGAAAGARAPSGIPAVEDIPVGRRDGSDLEAAWSSEQPVQARRAARQSISDHSRAVLGFRSNFGGREAARGARDRARPRDTAA